MNSPKLIFLFFVLTTMFLSCQTKIKYPYSINDFGHSLQPYLLNIVSSGIVGFSTSENYLKKHATDKDLMRLSLSEHPVLRAAALRAILLRPKLDHFKVLMEHLDDTATIVTDVGEFGTDFSTVTDDLIENSEWKNNEEKIKTIDMVITSHNYLRSAYTILRSIEPKKKYYPYVKDMAQRDRYFEEIEYALFRLASYKNGDDVELIKSILTKNCSRIGVTSFRLMKEYPNNVYLDVLEEYGKRFLFQAICQERSIVDADYFFKAVASYKQEKSAEILEPILKAIPSLTCPIDTGFLHQTLAYSIWNNRCAAYSDMTKKIKPLIVELEEFNKDKLNFETGDLKFRETIRW